MIHMIIDATRRVRCPIALLMILLLVVCVGCSGDSSGTDGGYDGETDGGNNGHGVDGLPFGEGWYGLFNGTLEYNLVFGNEICSISHMEHLVICRDLAGNITAEVELPNQFVARTIAERDDGRLVVLGFIAFQPSEEAASILNQDRSAFSDPAIYRDHIEHGLTSYFAAATLSNSRILLMGLGSDGPNAFFVIDQEQKLTAEHAVEQTVEEFFDNGVVQTAADEIAVAVKEGYGLAPITLSWFDLEGHKLRTITPYESMVTPGLAISAEGQLHLLRASYNEANYINAFVDETLSSDGSVDQQILYPIDPDLACWPSFIGRIDDHHLVVACFGFNLEWEGKTYLEMTIILER